MKILVVDDTAMNIVLLEHILRDEACEIFTASSGEQAVELASRNKFALALLDVQMPGMCGYETAQAIKKLKGCENVSIIFITSIFQEEQYVLRGYETGGIDYIFRPVDPNVLRAKISVFLDLYRQKDEMKMQLTRSIRLAEALSRAEEKYRNIFEQAVEGIFQSTLSGDIIEANPAMAEIMKCDSPEEVLEREGVALEFWLNPEERDAYLQLLSKEGKVSKFEFQAKRMDGKPIWVSTSARLVTPEEGPQYIEGVLEDITNRKLMEMDLQRQATLDSLTEVPNRHLFYDHLDLALANAVRYGRNIAVLFIDLNRFKMVNDTYGHAIGDHLLKAVAQRLKQRVRSSDTLARLGGDEFGVCLDHVSGAADAMGVARDLLGSLEEEFSIENIRVKVGATIGVSIFPADGESVEELIKQADKAMYEARKRNENIGFASVDP